MEFGASSPSKVSDSPWDFIGVAYSRKLQPSLHKVFVKPGAGIVVDVTRLKTVEDPAERVQATKRQITQSSGSESQGQEAR